MAKHSSIEYSRAEPPGVMLFGASLALTIEPTQRSSGNTASQQKVAHCTTSGGCQALCVPTCAESLQRFSIVPQHDKGGHGLHG